MKLLATNLVVSSLALVNLVHAEAPRYVEQGLPDQVISVNEDPSPVPLKAGKELVRVWSDVDPGVIAPAANTNIVFMNRCVGGCTVVRGGSTNSTSVPDRSHIIGVSQGTLAQLSVSQGTWDQVMACMRDVFSPFNVVITDEDPGTAAHFEIMLGGQPGNVGMSNGVGGVSPATCASFIPNSLVFVFDVWGDNVEEICSTAAQEVAHSWSLDHTIVASDPLTYFGFNGRKRFFNGNEQCGSDCINGTAGGLQCSGPGNQTRACFCGGTTQNPTAEISALFGDGTPTPPAVEITSPKTGEAVQPGSPVQVNVTDDQGITEVVLVVDNREVLTLTSGPFAFNLPADLGQGTHNVKVSATDVFGTVGEDTVQVIVGQPCGKPADCPNATDACIGGRCVPGPGAQGGLGTDCSAPTSNCASGTCTRTDQGSFCTESCAIGAGQCPSGFGCLDVGLNDGSGVCFPGFDDGTGGCSSGAGGGVLFGLSFLALVFARRRR